MNIKYNILFLESVKRFIDGLSFSDKAKIKANIDFLEKGEFDAIYIKTLRTPINVLIVKKYRLLFFIKNKNIYFIDGFVKKTNKTPKQKIENTINLYKQINQNEKNK